MARFEIKEISQEEKDHWKKTAKDMGLTMKGLWKWITRDLSKISRGMKVKK